MGYGEKKMRWEKLDNGKWKLIGPSKGKIDPNDPNYSRKLRAQMKNINPYCEECEAIYNLADPCIHHLSDSPEHTAKYKAYQQASKKKRETSSSSNIQKKL
jgi:hypothetical protein